MNLATRTVEGPSLRAVFFDLDGTLVDSAPDIAAAVNELMAGHGLAPHSLEAVRGMIGNGIGALVERAFAARGVALSRREFRERYEMMIDIYADNLTRLTTLRPGAARALSAARAAGLRTGVVTNKPEGFSRIVLSRFGLLARLDLVIGGDSGYPKKPSPDMLLAACAACGCGANEAMLVGDSATDVATARAAGVTCIIVRGGYTDIPAEATGADGVIDRLDELEARFRAAGKAA
jgi:phosphoglycolate phosphatase